MNRPGTKIDRHARLQSVHDMAVALGAFCSSRCREDANMAKASPDDPVHPGWPAGAPDGQGGRFRLKDQPAFADNKPTTTQEHRHLNSRDLPPDAPQRPVPLTDDHGEPIIGTGGTPLVRPAHLDPQSFVCAGIADRDEALPYLLTGSSVMVALAISNLYDQFRNFAQDQKWDAQRVDGRYFIDDYRDYATIAIGLYMASMGIPKWACLMIQDRYAKDHSAFTEPPATGYTRLPQRNVDNTDIGYDLVASGRVTCSGPPG